MPVHIGVNKTEDNCLVAYKCLIVTLGIRDCLLVLATVGEFPEDFRWFPILILAAVGEFPKDF